MMARAIRPGLTVLLAVMFAGCVTISKSGAVNPAVVIIRNITPENIREVVIAAPVKSSGALSFGEISPVPAGASQEFNRTDEAKPLPDRLTVEWETFDGERYSQQVDLRELPNRRKTGGILVFEIGAGGRLEVFFEQAKAGFAAVTGDPPSRCTATAWQASKE